jgi:hypothetical protein
MSGLLNTASMLMCPHGGTVIAITSNTRVNASSSPMVRVSDTFVIAGCTFSTPGGPHPCMTVRWITNDLRSHAMSDFTLSDSSVGLCLAADQTPQGTVIISNTQQRVSGQ